MHTFISWGKKFTAHISLTPLPNFVFMFFTLLSSCSNCFTLYSKGEDAPDNKQKYGCLVTIANTIPTSKMYNHLISGKQLQQPPISLLRDFLSRCKCPLTYDTKDGTWGYLHNCFVPFVSREMPQLCMWNTISAGRWNQIQSQL